MAPKNVAAANPAIAAYRITMVIEPLSNSRRILGTRE
jgi:hypothetical protein